MIEGQEGYRERTTREDGIVRERQKIMSLVMLLCLLVSKLSRRSIKVVFLIFRRDRGGDRDDNE
jgi:hypothetical protein